ANTLVADLVDLRRQRLDLGQGRRFDGVSEARGKADSPQHPQLVFGETIMRSANGADDPQFQIFASAYIIEYFLGNRIKQQPIDSEVAALNIVAGILAELHLVGMTPV